MGAGVVRRWAIPLALVVFGLVASQAAGYTITIDGQVGDWGIDPKDYWNSDWDPYPGIYVNIGGSSEDYQPGTNGGYVGPGWGGQTYDAEAFYFTADEQYAYFCVVTGFPPGGTSQHDPGDIAIDIGRDGTWEFGIEVSANDGQVVGGLYEDVDWHAPTIFASSYPAYINSGTLAWDPDFTSLRYSALGCGHYVIEAAVPLAALPLSPTAATPFRAHWTEECGNDMVEVEAQFPEFPVIPEPGTTTLLSGGILAMVLARSRKRRKAKRK